MSSSYDIIVVGAGVSGLTAAYTIRKKSSKPLSILVLEAKDRVGGRTLTEDLRISKSDPEKKAKWDLGGQWVTDSQTNITRLLKELALETYQQFDDGKKILAANGKIVHYSNSIPNISVPSLIDLQLLMSKCNAAARQVSTLDPFVVNDEYAAALDEQSLAEFLYAYSFNATSRAIMSTALRAIYGLEPSQINALFAALYTKSGLSIEALTLVKQDCAQEKRIKGGAQQISELMLRKLNEQPQQFKIEFNRALIELVQEDANGTSVKTLNTKTGQMETFHAKCKVICSIPLNQYMNVKFTPELPFYKRHVFSNFKMGNYIKIIVTYERAFWREKGFSGEVVSDGSLLIDESVANVGAINVVYDSTSYEGHAALLCFIAAKSAVEWTDKSKEARQSTVIEELVRYFGEEAREFVHFAEKIWSNEPYTGGCPTGNITTGHVMGDYVRATREPFAAVHFCGTESATQWMGYRDGAVESGERAAHEVLYMLNKNDADYEKTYYYQAEEIAKKKRKQTRRAKGLFSLKNLIQVSLLCLILYGVFVKFYSK